MVYVKAVCDLVTYSQSPDKETPYIGLRFNVRDETTPFDGRVFYANLWLTDKCIDRTLDTLQDVMGWEGDNLHDFLREHHVFDGVVVTLVLDEETFEGKTSWKVKFINPANGEMKNPGAEITDDAARKIAEMYRGKIMLRRQERQARKIASPAPVRMAVPPPAPSAPPPPPPPPRQAGGYPAAASLPPVDAYDEKLPF